MARLSPGYTLISTAIALSTVLVGPVGAQQLTDTENRLLACAAIDNGRDRLACFDSVVESVRPGNPTVSERAVPPAGAAPAAAGAVAAASGVVPVSSESLPAEPVAVRAPASEPAQGATAEARQSAAPGPEPVPAPGPAPRATSGSAAGAAVATTPTAAGAAPASPAPAAKAADASASEDPAAEATGSAVITGVRENLDGRFTVELDNGEVWRETEGSRVGMPQEGASVTISRGVFGSYRMKIEGIPREARVRQVN